MVIYIDMKTVSNISDRAYMIIRLSRVIVDARN